MGKLFVIIVAAFLVSGSAFAQHTQINQAVVCNASASYDASSNGATQVVALTSGKSIYVCGYSMLVGGTATNVSLVYGTGTNCGTGQVALTPAWQFPANGGISDSYPFGNAILTPNGQALCVKTSAGNAVQVLIRYAKF